MFMPWASAVWKRKWTMTSPADDAAFDPQQLAVPRRRLGLGPQCGQVIRQCPGEVARRRHVVEQEHRRHHVLVHEHPCSRPASPGQCDHASLVGADERPLGRGKRDVEGPIRVLSVDQKWASDTERHLRRANRVLDVSPHRLRRQRRRADQRQPRPGSLLHPLATVGHLPRRVPLAVQPRDQLERAVRAGGCRSRRGRPGHRRFP